MYPFFLLSSVRQFNIPRKIWISEDRTCGVVFPAPVHGIVRIDCFPRCVRTTDTVSDRVHHTVAQLECTLGFQIQIQKKITRVSSTAENKVTWKRDYRSKDGWVLNSAGDLLFWVPPWLRDGLYFPQNSLVICARGTTKLDLSQFVHGTEWQKCIDPKFRDAK